MRPLNEIIVHCTATPEGRPYSREQLKRDHLARGFSDIGYHFIVNFDGSIILGRPLEQVGAHVEGHNTGTIGISYIGGVDKNLKPKDTRTVAQKATLIAKCKELIAKYPTIKKVSGHNQYAAKACPSFDVRKDPLGHLI